MNYQPLKYIYQHASEDAYTMLLLHGTGGDENDLLSLPKHFSNKVNVLSVRGNVSENGMPRFFKRLDMGVFDEADVIFRTHELKNFLDQVAVKEAFDINKIIALGYSNGANIAGSILLLYPNFLAGAVLYRPMLPIQNPEAVVAQKHTPVFTSNGSYDPTINIADTKKYIDLLKGFGFNVEDHYLSTSHGLTGDDLKLSVEWFKKFF